jgi:hypothetical protein
MKVRLIKPEASSRQDEAKRSPVEVPIIDTIRSWVRDFKSTRASKARLGFERIRKAGKT